MTNQIKKTGTSSFPRLPVAVGVVWLVLSALYLVISGLMGPAAFRGGRLQEVWNLSSGALFVLLWLGLLLMAAWFCQRLFCAPKGKKGRCAAGLAVVFILAAGWRLLYTHQNQWEERGFHTAAVLDQGVDSGGYYLILQPKDELLPSMKLYCTRTEAAMAKPGDEFIEVLYVVRPGQNDSGYLTFMQDRDSAFDSSGLS